MEFVRDNELKSKILNTLVKVLNFDKSDTKNLEIRYSIRGESNYECRIYCKRETKYNSRYNSSNYVLVDISKTIIFNQNTYIQLSDNEYNYLFERLSDNYLNQLNSNLDDIQQELKLN